MIKLIIFDLDGVLADTEHIHYGSLCKSINSITGISIDEIQTVIHTDGSTTKSKLKFLKPIYNLSDSVLQEIDELKQKLVLEDFDSIIPDPIKIEMLEILSLNYTLAIGSNTRKASADKIVNALGIRKFFKLIVSIDDVRIEKPDPAIYNYIMSSLNILPKDTLIIEDSPKGIAAAHASLANVLVTTSVESTTLEFIQHALEETYTNDCGTDGRSRITIC